MISMRSYLLLWLAVLFIPTCAVLTVADVLQAQEPRAVEFETPREEAYWRALQQCTQELETAVRRLEGEKEKVRTATVTVNLSCPAIPPCPEASGSCVFEGLVGTGLGVVAGGLVCALAGGGPDVVVAR